MSKFSLHNTVNRSAVNKSKIATYSCLKLSLLQSEYLTFFFSKKGEICQIYLPPPPHLFHLYWLLPPHTLHLFTSHLWDINSHHQLQVCAKYPLCFLFYYFLIPDNLDLFFYTPNYPSWTKVLPWMLYGMPYQYPWGMEPEI